MACRAAFFAGCFAFFFMAVFAGAAGVDGSTLGEAGAGVVWAHAGAVRNTTPISTKAIFLNISPLHISPFNRN